MSRASLMDALAHLEELEEAERQARTAHDENEVHDDTGRLWRNVLVASAATKCARVQVISEFADQFHEAQIDTKSLQ